MFGHIDIANLLNPFLRIRIIMGKFGCTKIRTSSSLCSEKKKDFLNLFLGFIGNILPRGLIGLMKKMAKKNLDQFFEPPGDVFAKKLGYRGELGGGFG